MRIIRKKEAVKREISKTYKVKNFLTKHDCEQLSVAVGVAENHSEITKNTKSNRAYFVLKGELIVNGQKAKPGEVVFIPAGEEYKFEGTFEAVLINFPAFDPKFEMIKDA